MARQERPIALLGQDWEHFDNIKNSLDHDSDEETLKVLIELGFKAVAITDKANRTVNFMGGPKRSRKNYCKKCGEEREETFFTREMSLQLGVDEASLQREREKPQAQSESLDRVTEFMEDSQPEGD